jgi:hypothetical protein
MLIMMCLVSIQSWTVVAAEESTSSIEQTFQKAKQDYLDKNMDAAAAQIKKGAAFMKEESIKASDKGKEALAESARDLEKLSADVKKGSVKSVKKIEDAFGRAYHALARDAHVKSTESWAKKESANAGESLDKAAIYLERGLTWTGQKIETGTKNVMKKSKELSAKLKEKGRVVAEDIGKNLKEAGNEIEKFGKKISAK